MTQAAIRATACVLALAYFTPPATGLVTVPLSSRRSPARWGLRITGSEASSRRGVPCAMLRLDANGRRGVTSTYLAAPGSMFVEPATPSTIGLLHPATMAQLLRHQSSSNVFRDDPAMAAFLKDFTAGGPMLAMKHLSDAHVTTQLVHMLAEVNSCPTRYL